MNTHPASTPTFPGAPRHFGPTLKAAAFGGGLLLAGLAAFGLWTRDSGDLNAPAAPDVSVTSSDAAPSFSVSVDRRGWTFYMVGSEAEATTLRAGLAEADVVRYALGEPALLEAVLVVGSDSEAEALAAAVTDGNMTLAALGLGEDRVVDFRGD